MREGPLTALFRKSAEEAGASIKSPRPTSPPRARSRRPPRLSPRLRRPTSPSVASRRRRSDCATRSRRTSPRTCWLVQKPPPSDPEPERDVYARPDATQPPAPQVGGPLLRVVGVGGAGVNAVNRMVEAEVTGVEFLAINTDLQSLQQSAAHETLHIGDSITRGLGSG